MKRWRCRAFCISVVAVVVVSGAWNPVAAHKAVKVNVRVERRVPPAKSDLSGTLAGLKIITVGPNSAAARVGLRYGDVLIAYNNRPITSEEELDAVMRYFSRRQDQTQKPVSVELSLYRDGDMTVRKFRAPLGRLGIYTREWTFAGAFIEEAVSRDDYVSAKKHLAAAEGSGDYTGDQILHMKLLCLNNEVDADKLRQNQVDELYRKHPLEKLRLFATSDLLYHKRYRAAATVFEKYLQIKRVDLATEVALASCYSEIKKYDEADALLARITTRPETDEHAATEYVLSELSNLKARIYMGRGEYGLAQEHFRKALDQYANDSYYTLAFLYCAARREVAEGRAGEFEAAYSFISARSEDTEELMGYHIDALRAFVMVKRQRVSSARATVAKWVDSAEARRFVPIFWRNFPAGGDIVENWNRLLGQPGLLSTTRVGLNIVSGRD
jgi:tetratricopeptide (TPR) repeat protein